jgi:hypothetical protein
METISIQQTTSVLSNKMLWTGRIISGLCTLFFLMDAIMKLIRESHHVEGTIKFGYPDYCVQVFGAVLLLCTILYTIPRTAILGAILLTGYLGGAIATMVIGGEQVYFALTFGVLVWAGIYLRDEKLRALIPVRKETK